MSLNKVLIVDDSVEIYELLKRVMELYEIDTDYAENGEKALELIRYGEYDFIFLDLIMPRMYGVEVLKELKKMNKQKTPKIVLMTGCVADELIKETMELGVKMLLNKPFEIGDVAEILNPVYAVKMAV